jgi:hypothetical protein
MTLPMPRIFLLACFVQGLASCSNLPSAALAKGSEKPPAQSQAVERAVENHEFLVKPVLQRIQTRSQSPHRFLVDNPSRSKGACGKSVVAQ